MIKLKMSSLVFALVCFVIAISETISQTASKPGQCPPSLPLEVCEKECNVDDDCKGIDKCCGTTCGGAVCTFPVSIRRRVNREKPGHCPDPPTGRWVCSSTCNVDVECRGRAKCCRNRCGALVCTTPESEPPTPSVVQPDAEGISARQPEFNGAARQPGVLVAPAGSASARQPEAGFAPRRPLVRPEFENPPEEPYYPVY